VNWKPGIWEPVVGTTYRPQLTKKLRLFTEADLSRGLIDAVGDTEPGRTVDRTERESGGNGVAPFRVRCQAMGMLSRRECLMTLGGAAMATRVPRLGAASIGAKPMRGVFIILTTPFASDGAVDWDDLSHEVAFVDRGGCQGVVWPQGSSGVTTLTRDERLHGMDVLAKAVQGRRLALVLGVQGKDLADMLEYAKRAEALGTDAMIAMPPTTGTSMDDYRAYFRALARVTARPTIVQTSGGASGLVPSTDLIVELAREFPNCGYVKEESQPLIPRMKAELLARPTIRGVFGASFADGWLYEMRLGLDGVMTGEGMYADLMARIWDAHEHGRHDEARDAFSAFLLMRNLEAQIPGTGLYVMKRRGVFKTTVRRVSVPTSTSPATLTEFKPTSVELEEIEYRFAALKPYLTL
jgi:1-pyrroline-4-hydroxy-2-carboxylate deaminase